MAICAGATPSHIPSLVHATHAREKNGFRMIPTFSSFSIPGLMYLTLAGRNISTTARRFYFPQREYSSESIAFDMIIGRRFPNPVPFGTRIPQWTLIDVTVRKISFFFR